MPLPLQILLLPEGRSPAANAVGRADSCQSGACRAAGGEGSGLLDPTLDQPPDFAEFLRLLGRGNEEGRLKFSGELRAEGIGRQEARLLRQAGFHEIEVGLQSVEPRAWELMGQPTNLARFRRGVRALLDEGVKVCVDLMLGLPGETVDSARRAVDFLLEGHLYSTVQVFNLSILPGTAFRRQAKTLGLRYQPWPPYYVVETPSLTTADLCRLMEDAEEALGVEFDRLPLPRLDFSGSVNRPSEVRLIELDAGRGQGPEVRRERGQLAPAGSRACATRFGFARPISGGTGERRRTLSGRH